jgi:hypothetical protein
VVQQAHHERAEFTALTRRIGIRALSAQETLKAYPMLDFQEWMSATGLSRTLTGSS